MAVGGAGPAHRVSSVRHLTFAPGPDDGLVEDDSFHGLHPLMVERLQLWRLANFAVERLPAAEDVYLVRAVAHANPKDQRLLALRRGPRPDAGARRRRADRRPAAARAGAARRPRGDAPGPGPAARRSVATSGTACCCTSGRRSTSRIDEIERVARSLAPATEGLGIEEVGVQCLRPDPATGELRERLIRLDNPTGTGFVVVEDDLPTEPLLPLDEYTQKVVQSRRRGAPYPYELVKQLVAPRAGGRADVSGGSFQEHDLDADGRLVPVDRPPGRNTAGIVVGVVTTTTDRYPEGMVRVALAR